MRDKNQRKEPGGRRDDTCDHGLSRRSWKVDVCGKRRKKKKTRSIAALLADTHVPRHRLDDVAAVATNSSVVGPADIYDCVLNGVGARFRGHLRQAAYRHGPATAPPTAKRAAVEKSDWLYPVWMAETAPTKSTGGVYEDASAGTNGPKPR